MFISEIIEKLRDGNDKMEICATAETQYDPSGQKISVTLDSFARCVSTTGDSEHFSKDVFQTWVRKVHATIPLVGTEAIRELAGSNTQQP